jgi:hypothetical protein
MTRSPILFLIFNRPDTTARVFDSIRKARPARLYIAADGPRESRAGEADICEHTRKIAQEVDWPCEVKTLLRSENLGCKKALKYWSTVFTKVRQGEIDTWDYQWVFTCFKNGWLSCIPKRNLVTNIGFGPNATHTTSAESKLANVLTGELDFPLLNPKSINNQTQADLWTLNEVFETPKYGFSLRRLKASANYRFGWLFNKLRDQSNG